MNFKFLMKTKIDGIQVNSEALLLDANKGIIAFNFGKGARVETMLETCIHLINEIDNHHPTERYKFTLSELNRALKSLKDQRRHNATSTNPT